MTTLRAVFLILSLAASATEAAGATLLVPSEYGTIQAAVNAAADGDEVLVSPGVYQEQVVINRSITLAGAGIGQTVLLAPTFMPYTVHALNYNAVIHAEGPATSITLRDFTVDGAGRGREDTRFVGIMYDRAGGTAERIQIINLHETPVSTAVSGIGFYSNSESGDDLFLLVSDLEITHFQKTGFACFGSGCVLDIRNTVVDASSLYSDAVQNGFELLNSSSGTMTNCTARWVWYDGDPIPGTTSVGFVFYYADTWTLDDCLADQCQSGLYGIYTDFTAHEVTVVGHPLPLNFNYGIVTRGLGGGLATADPHSADLSKARNFARPRPLVIGESTMLTDLGKMVTLDNTIVVGDKVDGSVGVVAFSSLEEVGLTLENSTVAEWEIGILTSEVGSDWVEARARNSLIEENTLAGIWASTIRPFDARGNHWGDPTGPFHESLNPMGGGDEVVDNVIFDPWLVGNVVCGPVPQYIAQADADGNGYSREVVMRYLGGSAESVYGFSIELTWNQNKLTAEVGDVSRPDTGLFQAATLFQTLPISGGLRVDGALGGGQAGIASGALFKVRFHLVGEPDYLEIPINVNIRHLRDNQNQEISGFTPNDGLVIGDVQAPVFENLKVFNSTLAHTNDFAKNGDLVNVTATILDGDPYFGRSGGVGNFLYLYGSPGWFLTADEYLTGDFTWLDRPASLFPADGNVEISITATDPAGNSVTASDQIISDNTPPLAITGLVVDGDHNQVTLQWDEASALDENLRHIVIRSNQTNDYPFFQAPDPGYPAHHSDGQSVYSGLGTGTSVIYEASGAERDVVYFQAFAVDQVDLFSAPVPGSHGRTTNYLLADVIGGPTGVYDGMTDIFDVTRLGDTFGLLPAEPNFNGECDVGPTDDGTIDGIPEPDGVIGFDDLMIFSMAFERDLNPGPPESPPGTMLNLVWRQATDSTWVLELTEPCPFLKGLHLRADLPLGETATVTAGPLLQEQAAPFFLHAEPDGLDVSLAMLGAGVGVIGTGELLRLETPQTLDSLPIEWDARGLDNTRLTMFDKLPKPKSALPATFVLHGNHPNPFNPATEIVFDLPSPQSVQLVIYGIDGRQVARLRTATLEAGRQQLIWRGRDDQGRTVAAGLYLYRLQAGPWFATGKLNLVK